MVTMSDPADLNDVGAPILDWFGAACVGSGNGNILYILIPLLHFYHGSIG